MTVVDPSGDAVSVDAELADLLPAIWDHGWRTHSSCQSDGRGAAQVVFTDHRDAFSFVRAAFGEPATAPVRINTWIGPSDHNGSVYFPNSLIGSAEERLRLLEAGGAAD